MKLLKLNIFLLFVFFAGNNLYSQQRFPKPEFESGHTQPPVILTEPRSDFLEYLDVFVLIATLSLVSWFVIKKRSRMGVFWMTLFSLAYFGFYRNGCICSIGAIQNVTLAIFNPSYSIPITALLFFIIPLIFTLFYGRTFCAGVCPLGAIQDLVVFQPVKMKSSLQSALGLIPYVYLTLSILYAATSTDFIICRYDPFVGIFRVDATFIMFMLGALFLIAGIFIARPYCRFFCPYGVLLNLVSRISKRHMTITPSECISCKLCEDSCPFGAIEYPKEIKQNIERKKLKNRFIYSLILTPVFVLAGALSGYYFHENLAKANPTVQLALEVKSYQEGMITTESVELEAFRSMGTPIAELYNQAAEITQDFKTGSIWAGAFIGLVIGLTLIRFSSVKQNRDYTPNKGTCFSCNRCVDYCPVGTENEIMIRKTLNIDE